MAAPLHWLVKIAVGIRNLVRVVHLYTSGSLKREELGTELYHHATAKSHK